MSIRLMAAVWELDLTPVEKLVFLALADCANDEGLAWPSIATIRRKANVGERTVQRSIRTLEAMGMLTRQEVVGRGCKYTINPRHSGTPASAAPPPQSAQTPATVAPKPSRTINNKKEDARARSLPTDWCPILTAKAQSTVAGWPPGRFENEVAAFRDHAADKGRTSKDWQAAFRTWINNANRWSPKNAKPTASNDEPQNPYVRAVLKRQADRAGVGF